MIPADVVVYHMDVQRAAGAPDGTTDETFQMKVLGTVESLQPKWTEQIGARVLRRLYMGSSTLAATWHEAGALQAATITGKVAAAEDTQWAEDLALGEHAPFWATVAEALELMKRPLSDPGPGPSDPLAEAGIPEAAAAARCLTGADGARALEACPWVFGTLRAE